MYPNTHSGLENSWRNNTIAARHIVSKFTTIPPPDLSCFTLINNLELGAKVRVEKTLKPKILFNQGTFYTLNNIALKTSKRSDTFNKYSTKMMSDLSQLWALMHELGHWMLGHCTLHKDSTLEVKNLHLITLFPSNKKNKNLTLDEKICLELQADGTALELMLYDSIFISSEHSLWSQYGQIKDNSNMHIDSVLPRVIAVLTASCTTVLLFESKRLFSNKHSIEHPLPLTRLTNLVAIAFRVIISLFDLLEISSNGKLILNKKADLNKNTVLQKIFISIIAAFFNLKPVIDLLSIDLEDADKRQFESLLDFETKIPFFQNLQRYMIGAGILHNLDSYHKKSIEEYIRVHKAQTLVNNRLRDNYSLIEI